MSKTLLEILKIKCFVSRLFTFKPTNLNSTFFILLSSVLLSSCELGNNLDEAKNIIQWPLIENCNLHQEICTSVQNTQSVTLKISPHPVPIARTLGIELQLNNITATKIALDISGVNMYMGYNRTTLAATDKPGRYIGTSMLAFCTNEKMQWQITLMIDQVDGSQIQVPYTIETINR